MSQLGLTKFLCLALLLSWAIVGHGQHQHWLDEARVNELFEDLDGHSQSLFNGDSEFVQLPLTVPVYFYSETYNEIFINTNGILTFTTQFVDYISQPFPLEYPSIAPFYSNVDTTGADETTSITIFESVNADQLKKATDLVRYAYTDKSDFEASNLVVATWKNVGYFDSKTDKQNTFQAILICSESETFVQFIYPDGGLNWLQGETGDLGLPDIRAQAGFIAEDGRRFHTLDGSGSENVLLLSDKSNVGVSGVWLFKVGAFNYEDNIQEPSNEEFLTEMPPLLQTCSEGSHKYCHSKANCFDKYGGFCCVCQEGFYGNGRVCLKNDDPIRVEGSLMGEINGHNIEDSAKLQSYVVTADGRSYTAIHPTNSELGSLLRVILPIPTTIGWLFAKPMNGAANGYKLTGGEFLHTSKIQFESGEVLRINQTFEGLDYWDRLAVKMEIFGKVPVINAHSKLHLADYVDEYKFVSQGELSSLYAHTMEIPEENRVLNFQIEQTIHFENCLRDEDASPVGTSVLQKVSKIVLDYVEKDEALRTSVLTKIGVDAESNACSDGSAVCGENTVCIPYEDTFRCDCLHGYAPQVDENGQEYCTDIDECQLGTHVCDENALCTNNEGGFTCVCFEGFHGNGFRCLTNSTIDNLMVVQEQLPDQYGRDPNHYEDNQREPVGECYRCSHDADCVEGRCECREGFQGDGYSCYNKCGHDEVWEHGKCVPTLLDEHSIEPTCDFKGECNCPEGYEYFDETRMCHYSNEYKHDETSSEELVPCDVDRNCHINGTCEWYEHEMRHICTCNRGFRGDGYNCEPIDDSCALSPEICDPHATCQYNDAMGKSLCLCGRGYEGDGFRCQLAPECHTDSHCGTNAICDDNVCQCISGYERDVQDNCVQAGLCGTVFCGHNAVCKWDAIQAVQYCQCIEGYQGNPLDACLGIPPSCNVQYNCGAHAKCEPTEDPAKYECQCDAGYHGDGYICIEDQNCLNNPNMCDMNAQCHSTNSGLVCVCNQGFYGNGYSCQERQQHESGFLLVSQGVVIVRVPLNGKNVKPISVASMAIGLDKDCVEGRLYWGDISAKKIMSAKYDGTDAKAFITEDIESPEGIAIDTISRRIYWTDSVKDTIEVASLEDSSLRTIIISKNLVNPRGIVIDTYREKLYWSDWNRDSPKIEMSNLDGTEREMILGKDSVNLPNSLVVLESTGELCFADAGTKKVECIDAYTKQTRTISNELSYPFGLTFTHDHFYWTDWSTKKLESVDVNGNRQLGMQTPFFGSHKMYGMTAVEDKCPQMSSPCQVNNGACMDSRICLVNRKAPSGRSCKCTSLSQSCSAPQFGIQY